MGRPLNVYRSKERQESPGILPESTMTISATADGSVRATPKDWTSISLGDAAVFSFENGLWTGKKTPFTKAQVLRNTNFNNDGTLDYSDVATLDIESRLLPRKQLLAGDIIIERSGGGPKQPVGRVAYFDLPQAGFSFSNFTSRLRVIDKTKVDPAFVLYALLQFHKAGGTLQMQSNTTGIRNLNFKDYRRIRIAYPRLTEQRAIASALSKIQLAVKTQDNTIAKLKELKATTMVEIFRRGLNGRNKKEKETEIGTLPENWTVARLDTLADLFSGGTPSKARPEWWCGTMPWASPKDMKSPRLWDTQDHITEEALENGSRAVPAKTIFIVIRGMILAKDVPIAITETRMAFNQDMKAIVRKPNIDADFLFYAICAHKGALSKAIGTSAHGTRCIGSSSLEKLLLPVPTELAEQRAIATALRKLEDAQETASKKRGDLRTLFTTMLHQLMTGQTRVLVQKNTDD